MSIEEKMIETIKNYLIRQWGYNFLRLSEKDQNNLIIETMREFKEQSKAVK